MKIELKSKQSRVIALALCLAVLALAVFGYVSYTAHQRTRDVFAAIKMATEHKKENGETWYAYHVYANELRAINTDSTPAELKQALAEYVQGLDEGLALMRDGRDTSPAAAKIKRAYRELTRMAKEQ